MAAIHIGIGHDDNAVIAKLADIKPTLRWITGPDPGPERCDQRADFRTGEHLVEARAFHIQDFAFERQDRLEGAVTPLLRGTAGAVTLNDEYFAFCRITFLTIRKLAGQG